MWGGKLLVASKSQQCDSAFEMRVVRDDARCVIDEALVESAAFSMNVIMSQFGIVPRRSPVK